jgi:tRNA uridine 5-carbamoylmethylation protein Kti12
LAGEGLAKPSFVFLLGRPGAGKSAIYRILSKRLVEESIAKEVTRVDDFPVLQELLGRDKEFKRHYWKEGGFVITDFTLLDDVLKKINTELKHETTPGKITFVEFARDRYLDAMKKFDREVLDRSLILYVYCPFDICMARNIRRFEEAGEKTPDEHIAPSDIMERYYKHDDYEELFLKSEEELKRRGPAPLVVVRNDTEDLERLKRELEKVVEVMKEE